MSKSLNEDVLSELTKAYVSDFEKKKKKYDALFAEFQEKHQDELLELDAAREEMNAALDDARRALREDAKQADYRRVKRINFGGFRIQKKWSSHYIVEMFVELIKDHKLFDAAVDEGVISVKTEIDGDQAREFLRKNSLEEQFKVCIDGKELTPAISGPKPVAAFGGTK